MLETYRKLFDLLDRRARRNTVIVLSMMLILGMMEALGVASIMPFIAVLTNPEIINNNTYLSALYASLELSNANEFLFVLAAIVFVVAIGRIGLAALTYYSVVRFSTMRNYALSTQMLERYLRQPYTWFLRRHSSELGKTVLSEVDTVIEGSLIPSLQLIARTLVALFVISVLIFVNHVIALTAILVLGGGYTAIYAIVHPQLNRIGKDRLQANRQRFLIAQEVLGGIKEVKVGGLESAFLQRFENPAHKYARKKAVIQFVGQLPRHLLETITIGGMLIVVMVLLAHSSGDLSKVLPIVGLYAFAGLRLMPALQDIYQNLTKIGFGRAALEHLHNDLKQTCESEKTGLERKSIEVSLKRELCLDKVTYKYPDANRPILSDLSLSIAAKTTVGFVGATGAGKTTIIDIILGLLRPQSGKILVDDTLIDNKNIRDWQRTIGYVPQNIFLSDTSIANNIAFGIKDVNVDIKAVKRAAQFAELHEFITDELPNGYDTIVGERGVRLSGGQRQRIGIARALYHNPQILILDEATSALDNLTEKAIMDAIRNLSNLKTILIIAHRLATVRTCDRIFLLERGKIKKFGTYDELLDTDAAFQRMVYAV